MDDAVQSHLSVGEVIPASWQQLLSVDLNPDGEGVIESNPTSSSPNSKTNQCCFYAMVTLPVQFNDTSFQVSQLWEMNGGVSLNLRHAVLPGRILLTQSDALDQSLAPEHQIAGHKCFAPLFIVSLSAEDHDRYWRGADIVMPTFSNLETILFQQGMPIASVIVNHEDTILVARIKKLFSRKL